MPNLSVRTEMTTLQLLIERRPWWCLAVIILVCLPCAMPDANALVITPIYDSSISDLPNAAAIKAGIQVALNDYSVRFSDPVTVVIRFQSVTGGLGASETAFQPLDYLTFRSRLAARATTTNDTTALAHLPPGSNSPVKGISTLQLTTAHLRVLGVDANPAVGEPDSTVSLNTSILNAARTGLDPEKYDLISTVYHEVNEVLGLNSALDGLNNGDPTPTDAIGVLDLFRYKSNGQRGFDTVINTAVFLSLDGLKDLVQFNQDSTGDFHDWAGPGIARVQDAFGTPGTIQNQSAVELIALDAIGYTPMSTPLVAGGGTYKNGQFGFDLSGPVGNKVVVDASVDLKTWTPVWTNTLTGTIHFTDSQSATFWHRSYRARVP